MLKTDILNAISQQQAQLKQEMSDIEKRKNSRSCVTAFFNSLAGLFRNELEIKDAKLKALNDLHDEVNKDKFQSVDDFNTYIFRETQAKSPTNRGLVFSGFFNRTEKLFNLVRSYLTEREKVQAINNKASNLQTNKL